MESRTLTAVFEEPKDVVFAYLADVANLPKWATEFARELTFVDGKAKVRNGLGEFFFSIAADAETGVIDMYAGPTEDQLAVFPTRVVELPNGRSAYTFTMFRSPETPDELFESQHESLVREFDNLRRTFSR